MQLKQGHAELSLFLVSLIRVTEMDHDSVLPACQTTLKNLQLEYLDLYLFHWPVALRKGADFKNLSDEDRLGYDPDRVANCWKVCFGGDTVGLGFIVILFACVIIKRCDAV